MEDHPVVTEPTIEGLLGLLEGTELVYIHGMDGKIAAMVIPVEGWWHAQMPDASIEHFAHDHIRIDGRVP